MINPTHIIVLALAPFIYNSPTNQEDHKNSDLTFSTESFQDNNLKYLFNGKDLSGWKIHGTEKWYVESGQIVCESGPDAEYGYLATEDKYKNFELTLDFKQEADGNSGVFFRSSLDGTNVTGWQVEVAPPGNDTGGIYESNGRGWLEQVPKRRERYLKMGYWNQLKVRVIGDEVTTWLNNHEMVDLKDEKIGAANGVIALQIHSGGGIKVRWRNIMVRQIE